jgi:hypothetical protein
LSIASLFFAAAASLLRVEGGGCRMGGSTTWCGMGSRSAAYSAYSCHPKTAYVGIETFGCD